MNQEQKVLNYLKTHGSLTGVEAQDLFRIRDLPKRISVLRRQGHEIVRTLKTDVNGQRYARYSMAIMNGVAA